MRQIINVKCVENKTNMWRYQICVLLVIPFSPLDVPVEAVRGGGVGGEAGEPAGQPASGQPGPDSGGPWSGDRKLQQVNHSHWG